MCENVCVISIATLLSLLFNLHSLILEPSLSAGIFTCDT